MLVVLTGMLAGCARQPVKPVAEPVSVVVPEPPATQFQSSLGKVALSMRVELPELRFMRFARDPALARSMSHQNFSGGSGCGGGNIGTCVLVGLTVGVIAGAIESAATDRKSRSVQGADEVVSPKLEVSLIQDGLRDAIIAAAKADGVKLSIAPAVGVVDTEGEPDYRALAAKGIDTVLEVTLHQVFIEPNIDFSGKINLDPVLPLDMQTNVRVIRTRDNTPLLQEDYFFRGKRYQYTEWASNSGEKLTMGLNKGYATLGRDIADRVFLLYPFADRVGNGESGYCGLGVLEPKQNLADDLSPLLSWKSFPRTSDVSLVPDEMKRVKNVRYELLVGTGGNGEMPDVLYHVEELTETTHRVAKRLEPNTRYFWSVRARFDLDGRTRVTDWATHCPFGRQLVVGSSIYRFYTPKVGRTDRPEVISADTSNVDRTVVPQVNHAVAPKVDRAEVVQAGRSDTSSAKRAETQKWVKGPSW
jgi:hypothetical protein